jgi:GTPase
MNDSPPMPSPAAVPDPNQAPAPASPDGKAGIVAVIGRANVGKSSLVNALLGEKISIVSPVAQTTRHRIRGILTEPRGQVVLLDTPGVHRSPGELGRMMNAAARKTAEAAEEALLVLDGSVAPQLEDEGWMRRLAAERGTAGWMVAVNKRDLGDAGVAALRAMWTRIAKARELDAEALPWHSVSSTTGEGVAALPDAWFARLPVHPPLFPDDVLTDFPRKLFMADVIREKLFLRLRDELPHRVTAVVDEIGETPEGGWRIAGRVLVERGSQLGIVLGHKGRQLRAVRRAAEAELSGVYERTVELDLRVTVEPNWTRNFFLLRQLGMGL